MLIHGSERADLNRLGGSRVGGGRYDGGGGWGHSVRWFERGVVLEGIDEARDGIGVFVHLVDW